MLEPRYKYMRAFCSEEEIAFAETTRRFVDEKIMPYRHDLEGGWHRDEELALQTLHRLYSKLVDLGITKTNLPEKHGGLGLSPVVRQMVNEELSRADIGLATMVGKIHSKTCASPAARSFAGDTAEMVTNRAMELMGSLGYAFESHVERYMRDFKIVKIWLGGAQRDRLDIAQGLYGPFKWAGFDEWLTAQQLLK